MKRKGSAAGGKKRARKNGPEDKCDAQEEPGAVVSGEEGGTGDGNEETGGLVLYADIHPACQGPGANPNGLTPVEVSPSAAVSKVISELQRAAATIGEVRLKHQGCWLNSTTLLADAGVCQESALGVEPLLVRRKRTLSCGARYFVALNEGKASVVGTDRGWLPVEVESPIVHISTSYCRKLMLCENGDFYDSDWGARVPMQKMAASCFKSPMIQCDASVDHTLLLFASGEVVGLGSLDEGQGDIPKIARQRDAAEPQGEGPRVLQVAAGNEFSSAVLSDGSVLMWGKGFPRAPGWRNSICGGFGTGEGGSLFRFSNKAIASV
eukprot:Hpha_TRINITY_DN16188_c2_g1::TRINITY_DN16188_c2_g1_i2::g.4435::m.4435